MNFAEQIGFDALRSGGLAVLATLLGWHLGRGRFGKVQWALLLAPLLIPSLLISYAAAPWALKLVAIPWALHALYSALLLLKLIPLAAIARRLLPPELSAEAVYCARLCPDRPWVDRAAFSVRTLGLAPWVALGIAFTQAFSDFELASLLSVKTWTVKLFDAHAGGLEITESLRMMLGPALIQAVPIAAVVLLLSRWRAGEPRSDSGQAPTWALAVYAIVGAAGPLLSLLVVSFPGLPELGWQEVLGSDLLTSVGAATVSSGAAWLLAALLPRSWPRFLVVVPGLLGPLVLALVLVSLSQAIAGFGSSLQQTPVALLTGEVALLLPVAVLLRELVIARRSGSSLHLARMAGNRALLWDLAVQPRVAALFLLFLLAYFEITAAAILSPVGLTPIFVRLHNLAHYGQTAVLSAMLLAAVAAPAVFLGLTLGIARFYARRDVR